MSKIKEEHAFLFSVLFYFIVVPPRPPSPVWGSKKQGGFFILFFYLVYTLEMPCILLQNTTAI